MLTPPSLSRAMVLATLLQMPRVRWPLRWNSGSLIFNRSNDLSFAGAISGTGSLIKSGAGALTLTGTSGFTGAGTVGALTISSGGTLAPGNSSGIINSGTFSLNSGATLVMELTGSSAPVAGTTYDQTIVVGSVTLGGN